MGRTAQIDDREGRGGGTICMHSEVGTNTIYLHPQETRYSQTEMLCDTTDLAVLRRARAWGYVGETITTNAFSERPHLLHSVPTLP